MGLDVQTIGGFIELLAPNQLTKKEFCQAEDYCPFETKYEFAADLTESTGFIEISATVGWWTATTWVHSKINSAEYYDDLVCKWDNLIARECFITSTGIKVFAP